MSGASTPRFCVLTTSFPRTPDDDAGIFVARMVTALSGAGASGSVVIPLDSQEPRTAQSDRFTVRRFSYGVFSKGQLAFGSGIVPNIRRAPWLILQAPLLLLGFVRMAVQVNSETDLLQANWAPASLAAFIASIVTKKPYIVTLRGEDVRLIRKPLVRLLFGPCFSRASAIVSVNETFIDEIAAAFPKVKSKLRHIPNGVELPLTPPNARGAVRTQYSIAPETPVLLFVGTIIPRKAVQTLVQSLTHTGMETVTLLVAGRNADERYAESLNEQVCRAGLTSRVRFLGAVAPANISSLLAAADFYVSASEFEGRPNSLLEALSVGKLCIVSDIPAHRELIEQGTTGWLFISATELSTRVLELLGSPERCEVVGKAGQQSVSSYSWKSCAHAYIELANEIVSEGLKPESRVVP